MKSPRIVFLLVLSLLLQGCGVDWQVEPLGWTKKAVTVGAAVQTEQGTLTIYRFTQKRLTQGLFCGVGFNLQGPIGEGKLACDKMGALTFMAQTHGNMSILMGRVNDAKISNVTLSMDDGQKLTAEIGNGVWYALVPGRGQLPPVVKVDGMDQDGNVVYSIPVAPPRP